MATVIQDLDFVAPRDCELAWTGNTLRPPIRAGERVRYFGRHSLGDVVEVARGACAAAGAELTRVESRGTTLFVLIRGDYGKTLRVEELVRAAMPAWAEVRVLFGKDSAVASAARREFGCTVRLVEIETPRAAMISAVIARQVAAGGVDTEGTRHEAERWCAMLAGCVCDGMRATTNAAPQRCDECGGVAELVPLLGLCYYCTHRIGGSVRVVERGPGIAVDKTPGPHEGATAWASATWEDL